ncbi:MAG: SPFH domain-containing protein [Woeseiaceae bacterium]|nr:SPFH domain-containing protein [Woeseiaceae bacterium]
MLMAYYKGEPNTYTVCYRDGKVARHGAGINFLFSPLTTSIAAVPLASQDSQFVFTETTADFQEVAIQGALTFHLEEPLEIASRLNFRIDPKSGRYVSEDPMRLEQRVINAVQGHTRSIVGGLSLDQALKAARAMADGVLAAVGESPELERFGIVIEGLHFTSVRATPEMQKALEADFREKLNKRADQAIYDRRKAAVEEERKIRESEINTDVEIENRRKALVDTQARNSLALAEAEARAEELKLAPYGNLPSEALIGLALKDWAANAGKIDSLSITPDLLTKVVSYVTRDAGEAA